MSKGVMSYTPSISHRDQNLLRASHLLSALHSEPPAHHGSKDASLNDKKNDCILFSCNPFSHNKSCVHQLSSRRIMWGSSTLLRGCSSTFSNHCPRTAEDFSPLTPPATNLLIFQILPKLRIPPAENHRAAHWREVQSQSSSPAQKPLTHPGLVLFNSRTCQEHH